MRFLNQRFVMFGLLLFVGCITTPSGEVALSIPLLYYPQVTSVCPQGVLVSGVLTETNSRVVFGGVDLVANGAVSPFPAEGQLQKTASGKQISFRLTQPAGIPSQSEATTSPTLLPGTTWDRYYRINFVAMGNSVTPQIAIQCSGSTPSVSLNILASQLKTIVVVEDPSVEGKIKVVAVPLTNP